jgi:predicted Fe-Mo cluster-binding NifX family protein
VRIAIPITPDGLVDGSWGRAPRVAVFDVDDGVVTNQHDFLVEWDRLHDEVGEGSHHARVARFLRDNTVDRVAAQHMGPPMAQMLGKMGIGTLLGVSGDASAVAQDLSKQTS